MVRTECGLCLCPERRVRITGTRSVVILTVFGPAPIKIARPLGGIFASMWIVLLTKILDAIYYHLSLYRNQLDVSRG
jgi:hypothetical protein